MKVSLPYKLLVLTLTACGLLEQTVSALVTIDTLPVGNAGNAADPYTGYGAVSYDYGIGKYEVTLDQYATFLNAVAKTDPYALYAPAMGADTDVAGIVRSGFSGGFTYSVIGSGNRPVTYVSWFDAARFVNWLHNGQPTGSQNASTTEQGAYTLNGVHVSPGVGITRNANSIYALPNENEWYKAAYYQPAAQGGDADNYWYYPTQSNVTPNSRNGSTTDPNSANYFRDDHIGGGLNNGYAVPEGSRITDVGAFSLADSFFGTFDQGGNVWEWTEGTVGSSRVLRGGSWRLEDTLGLRSSTSRGGASFTYSENDFFGFRIVIIPEPSIATLAALGTSLLVWRRCKIS